MRNTSLYIFGVILMTSLSIQAQAADTEQDGWELMERSDGVTTWKQDVAGKVFPLMRGQVEIGASVDDVQAVVEDVQHHTQWMHRCVQATRLKQVSEVESVLYNRTSAPWPIRDRDVVMRVKREVAPSGGAVILLFESVRDALKPEVEGVVRMPKLAGYYRLEARGPNKTQVVYQIEADLGGNLPAWFVKSLVEKMPYETLHRLRERVSAR